MTSVITKATLNEFQNVLGLNRRIVWTEPQDGQRVHQINVSIDPTAQLVSEMADVYWLKKKQHLTRDYTQHFYSEVCKIRVVRTSDSRWLAPKNTGGYIVLDGELLALHSVIRGQGDWLMNSAVHDGAVRLSCFDEPKLIALYNKHGFREVRRELNTTKGRPDVVWMVRKNGPQS